MTERDQRKSFYMSYLEVCNAHDFDRMASFFTPNITVNDVPMDPASVAAQFVPIVSAFPDFRWEMRNLVVDGGYIAAHFTVTGTHRGNFNGIEATGRRVSISELTLYHLAGDKFDAVWDLVDKESLQEQLRQGEPSSTSA
jgi:predicted ester cyclase